MLFLPAMFDHKQTIHYVSAHLARLLGNRLREALTPLGILPAQFTAIAEIALDEGLTQKQLVERLDLEQPGVARTLTTMEAEGWIERRSNERGQGLYLTDKARSVLPQTLDVARGIHREALRELSRTEQAHLLDAMDETVETVGRV